MRRFAKEVLIYKRFKIKWLSGNLNFIGKETHNSDEQLPKNLRMAWFNNKQQVGGVLQSNKKDLVQNIVLIVPTVYQYGSLKFWAQLAIGYK